MTCSRAAACLCGLLVFCFIARPVDARVVSADVTFVNVPPTIGPPDFVWDLLPDQSGDAWMTIEEWFGKDLGNSLGVSVSGMTENSAIMTITKSVENSTGVTWIGYEIDLDLTGDATFGGTPSSNKMTLASMSSHNLTYGLPNEIPHGEAVEFSFDVIIPTSGAFGFTLTQSPVLIPEPSTAALMGVGFLALSATAFRRRRISAMT